MNILMIRQILVAAHLTFRSRYFSP